ncbi:MAG: DNA topoisomerase IV subunit A, partial [Methylobacterium sp.]
IQRRLEILDGYLAVFLNLDEVIRIIREEDKPKPSLMAAFSLTDNQAEAILNMRLRSLRRLEEMEIRKEHRALEREGKDLTALLKTEALRWTRIAEELEATREKFGSGPLGDRRTVLGDVPAAIEVNADHLIEREPITVVLSEKGWIRAVRGHQVDPGELKFKDGDSLALLTPCQTTDRLCLIASGGRAHMVRAGDLPRGRGDGQAIRLVAEMAQDDEVVSLFVWREGVKYLVANDAGRGFVVNSADLVAEKRTGKTVMNLKDGERLLLCIPATGGHVAVIGTNRKLLVFPLNQVPELQRGAGVQLQKYKDGKLGDARVFVMADGLSWKLGQNTRTETGIKDWLGSRAQAARCRRTASRGTTASRSGRRQRPVVAAGRGGQQRVSV